jgi:hypothetical protein
MTTPTNTTTIRRRNRVTFCVMLVGLFAFRNRLEQATSSLVSLTSTSKTHQTNIKLPFNEDEELQSMLFADDLLLSTRVPCGKEKCFFESKTRKEQGYLIARSSRTSDGSEKYNRLVEGWKLATRLQQKYKIKHFLVSFPEIVPVSDHLAALLNQNLWFETQDLPVEKVGNKKNKVRFPSNSQAYVQKVQVAPMPNLLLACAHSNRPHFERHLDQFLLNVHPNNFLMTFSKNLNATRELLQKEPCLMKDFQVLMDEEGEIYHLDFDRCFQTREVDETQECYDYLDEVERRIQEMLQDPFQADNICTTNQVPCGKEKCFFRTKSNDTIGYLVARSSHKENRKGRFESLQAAYALAQNLTNTHNAQHFLKAPPVQIVISPQLATRLNQNLWSEKGQRPFKTERYQVNTTAFIQRVQVAPSPHLLIGCVESKMGPFQTQLGSFMQQVTKKEAFLKTFQRSFKNVRKLIFDVEPCLIKDFQVFMDTTGNLYHLDFDRCFSPESATKKYTSPADLEEAPCRETLVEIEKRITRAATESDIWFQ